MTEKQIRFVCLAFGLFCFPYKLSGEEAFSEAERKNWAIQYSFGSGKGQAQVPQSAQNPGNPDFPASFLFSVLDPSIPLASALTGTERRTEVCTVSFHAEYYPNWFGFLFGVSSHQFGIFVPPDISELFFPALVISALRSNLGQPGSILLPVLLLGSLSGEEKISFLGSTLDFGTNFHLNRDGMWDPYLGLLAGIGTVGSGSSLYKGELRLGIRGNFTHSFYMFLEGYTARYELEVALGGGEAAKTQIRDSGGKLGFGIRL